MTRSSSLVPSAKVTRSALMVLSYARDSFSATGSLISCDSKLIRDYAAILFGTGIWCACPICAMGYGNGGADL